MVKSPVANVTKIIMSHCLGKKTAAWFKGEVANHFQRRTAHFLRQARLESMNIDPDVAPWPSKNGWKKLG